MMVHSEMERLMHVKNHELMQLCHHYAGTPHTQKPVNQEKCRMLKRDAERIAKRREEIPSNAPNRRSNLHFRLFKPAFRKHYFHFRFR